MQDAERNMGGRGLERSDNGGREEESGRTTDTLLRRGTTGTLQTQNALWRKVGI